MSLTAYIGYPLLLSEIFSASRAAAFTRLAGAATKPLPCV
ncbi:Uncharacterised protein [Mycobacterium tuberculosis]|nr:Uncharacterised protein [Mycobacterium tuberculosis]